VSRISPRIWRTSFRKVLVWRGIISDLGESWSSRLFGLTRMPAGQAGYDLVDIDAKLARRRRCADRLTDRHRLKHLDSLWMFDIVSLGCTSRLSARLPTLRRLQPVLAFES